MQRFKLKQNVNPEDLTVMSPKLLIAFGWFCHFAEQRGLPVVVTNVKEKFSVSVSNSHPEGRAIDISTKTVGWTDEDIETIELQMMLQDSQMNIGAISRSTGRPRIAYHHDAGLGPHFHLQVAP